VSIWFENDKKLPQGRLAAVSYGIVALIGLLLFGFWNLQVIRTTYYAGMAERNRVRSIPIIAPRGSILDRQGRVLVDNYPSFSVLLLRDDTKLMQSLLPQIADGLGMTLADLQQQVDAVKTLPDFQPIVIKPEASPADIAFIESHRPDIPVLEMMMVHRRRYEYGDFLAHAIGYVGEVSADEVAASGGLLRSGDLAAIALAARATAYGVARMYVDGHFAQWGVKNKDARRVFESTFDLLMGGIAINS